MLGPYRGEPDWQSDPWLEDDEQADVYLNKVIEHTGSYNYSQSNEDLAAISIAGFAIAAIVTFLLYLALRSTGAAYQNSLNADCFAWVEGCNAANICILGPLFLLELIFFVISIIAVIGMGISVIASISENK